MLMWGIQVCWGFVILTCHAAIHVPAHYLKMRRSGPVVSGNYAGRSKHHFDSGTV